MRVDRGLILAAGAGAFGSLDTSLNIAFPDLVDDFGIEVGQLQWVVVSFVLTYGGLLLATGQLGDRLGHQRTMAFGAAGSVVAMICCATAPTFGLFIAARVLQGVTTAAVMAAGPALASLASGDGDRARAISVFQLSAGVGAAMGPVIGAPLVDLAGWPAVFWFRVPVSLGLLALGLSVRRSGTGEAAGTGNDVRGAVLTALALAGGLLVINSGRELGWQSPLLWTTVVFTVAIAVAYRRHEQSTATPILDLSLFRNFGFAAANGLNTASNAAMFVAWLLLPSLLVDEIGLSVFEGGLVLAASPAAMAVTAPFAGRWSDRSRPDRPVVAGLVVEGIGLLLLASLDTDSSAWIAAAALALIGVGLGLFASPNMALVMSALPPERQGVASGLALLTRTAGIVVGVAGSSALFDTLEPSRGYEEAFSLTALASAAVAGLCVIVALLAARSPTARALRGGSGGRSGHRRP